MKKLMMAMATLFCISSFANWLVYDYRASIKRVEPVFKSVDGNCEYYVKQATDTIQGYLVIKDCEIDYEDYCPEAFNGYLYVYRRGDALYNKAIWKTAVVVTPAYFGTNFYSCKRYDTFTEQTRNALRATKCSVMIDFDFARPISEEETVTIKGDTCKYQYGFFGWFNKESLVANGGFGTTGVKIVYPKTTICSTETGGLCLYIRNASGSFLSKAVYKGECGGVGANSCNNGITDLAQINGTWTLKLNVSKTKSVSQNEVLVEDYILGLLKADGCFDATFEE